MIYEWLVWGAVPAECVLTVVSVKSIRRYIQAAPSLSRMLHLSQIEASENARSYNKVLRQNELPLCKEYGFISMPYTQLFSRSLTDYIIRSVCLETVLEMSTT